jgi:hypothetical protein
MLVHVSIIQSGRTALLIAARGGHTDCVRLLVERGADKEAADDVRDMIHRVMNCSVFSLSNQD